MPQEAEKIADSVWVRILARASMVAMGPLMTIVIVLGGYSMAQVLQRLDSTSADLQAIRVALVKIQLDSSRIDGDIRRAFDRLDALIPRIDRLEDRSRTQ